ncbi:MAG: hypothetical protein ACXW3D_08700 [Caulobacteraceae bacterium]
MRWVLIAAAAMTLSGCNMVYSERPLFAPKDTRGAPVLRTGLWVKPKLDCKYDASKPAAEIDECAEPLVITATDLRPPKSKAKTEGPQTLPYILVKGSPPVMQIEVDLGKEGMKNGKRVWVYQGLEITKTDEAGRVIAGRLWSAQCGQPPAGTVDADGTRVNSISSVTEHPLPGLKMVESNCVASNQKSVRNAVRASQAWDKDQSTIRWVRDGED